MLNLREEVNRGNREEAENERRSTDIEFTVFNESTRYQGTTGGEGTVMGEGSREGTRGERASMGEEFTDDPPSAQRISKGKEVMRDEGPPEGEETSWGEEISIDIGISRDEYLRRMELFEGLDTARREGSSRGPGTLSAL